MVGNVAHPWVVQVLDPVIKFLESLAFIGVQSHVIKLDYVDSKIQPVADSLGMALPLIKVRAVHAVCQCNSTTFVIPPCPLFAVHAVPVSGVSVCGIASCTAG